jgi:transposase-like protein
MADEAAHLWAIATFVSAVAVWDQCLGLVESLGEFYPEALWQRCAVHFIRNEWTAVPTSKVKEIAPLKRNRSRSQIEEDTGMWPRRREQFCSVW